MNVEHQQGKRIALGWNPASSSQEEGGALDSCTGRALSARSNQSHEDNHLIVSHHHLLSRHHLRQTHADMEFRDSFIRLKEKVKYRLGGSKPKQNKADAGVGGETVDSTGSRTASATAKLLLRG